MLLIKGVTGSAVQALQEILYKLGYIDTEPSGEFDGATELAVAAFQEQNLLSATGRVDDMTMAILAMRGAEVRDTSCSLSKRKQGMASEG